MELIVLNANLVSQCQQSDLPMIYDFSVTEGETNVMLRMMPLKAFSDRRLATTLVSPTHRLSQVLPSQLALVMIKDGQFFPIAQESRMGINQSPDYRGKLWEGYVPRPYNVKDGQLSSIAQSWNIMDQDTKASALTEVHFTPYLAASKTSKISKWVEESAARSASDPFKPSISHAKEAKQVHTQVAKDLQPEGTMRSSQTQDIDPLTQSPPKRAAKGRKPKEPAATETIVKATSSAARKVVAIPLIDSSSTTDASADVSKPVQKESQVRGASKTPSSRASISTVPTSEAKVLDSNALPALNPPYIPSRSNKSSIKSRADTTPDWATSAVPDSHMGQLIDISGAAPPATKPKDRARQWSEVAARKVRHTMKQRKAPTAAVQTTTGAIAAYEAAAIHILKLVRSFQGVVDIQTTIGRFFIDNKSGLMQWKKGSFAISQWHDVFPNKQGQVRFDTHLTERITVLASDTDFILELKLPSGRQIFVKEPCERKTYYRFTCCSSHKEDDEVIVEVDETENGKFDVCTASKLFGSINWHFPRRYWDASLTIRASRQSSLEQHEAAVGLVENLRITPSLDRTSIDLRTDTSGTVLTIKSVQYRRETRHRSVIYPDLLLRLSEVEELAMEPSATGQEQTCRAYSKPRKQMVNESRLWWEAALSSASATRAFTENRMLEIGETAKWTPEGLIEDGVVKQMSLLANDVVTRIDSVGYHNKGSKATMTKPPSQPSVSAADAGFW